MKEKGEWDMAKGVAAIRAILDRHMGAPPEKFEFAGVSLTPQEYRQKYVNLELDNYVTVLSLMQEPWYEWVLYDVPDNWWRSKAYYNVPVTDFTRIIRDAVRRGQTVCLLEDVSEPGFYGQKSIAIVPSFDIPSQYIDDSARQFRFSNGTTGDDHAVHIVGWTQRGGKYWYLVKDSGGSPRAGKYDGYMFYDEDYIRLKVLAVMLERTTVEQTLGRKLGPAPAEKTAPPVTASAG
jgi:bleomycin hydrolase